MAKLLGFVHSLEWHSPYTSPPEGRPKVLVEKFIPVEDEGCRQMPREIEEAYQSGNGYSYCIRAVKAIPRKLDPEVLSSLRQKRLKRRLEEKYPLLADQLFDQELKRNRSYYEGKTDPAREELREAVEKYHLEELIRFGVKG